MVCITKQTKTMQSILELRSKFNLHPTECTSSVKYFKQNNIDWDVYLESKSKNLQRDFVWDSEQKNELIYSILIGRHIPHMAFINTIDKNDNSKDVWLIIDGKQRLSTIFDFVDDKFHIIIDDGIYLYSELPKDYQIAINRYNFRYYVVNEQHDSLISDEQKIQWFKFINFSGTPQDFLHLNNL